MKVDVTNMAETGFSSGAVERLLRDGSIYKPVRDVADRLRSDVADKYLADVAAHYPAARRTVDKSIQTYLYLGVIKLIMPNAKFMIVQRDPQKKLLSIYRNLFQMGTHRYAYDFESLADHYLAFRDMIAFWKQQMPDDICIAGYDALVRDPESNARALVAACGLEWQDTCLEFYKSTGGGQNALSGAGPALNLQVIAKSMATLW